MNTTDQRILQFLIDYFNLHILDNFEFAGFEHSKDKILIWFYSDYSEDYIMLNKSKLQDYFSDILKDISTKPAIFRMVANENKKEDKQRLVYCIDAGIKKNSVIA